MSSPLFVQIEPSTISPGDTTDIIIKMEKPGGGLEDFPPDQLFYLFIQEGAEYGTIHSSELNDTSDNFADGLTGSFSFIAADAIPYQGVDVEIVVMTMIEEDNGGVIITKTSNGNSVTSSELKSIYGAASVRISQGEESLFVDADPRVIIPGGESQLILMLESMEGVTVPFPPDQLFYLSIDEGYEYGTLYSSELNDTADYFFDGLSGEFSFFAKDSIDVDTVHIGIWVATFVGDDPNTMISSESNRIIESELENIVNHNKKRNITSITDNGPPPGWLEGWVEIMVVKSGDCSEWMCEIDFVPYNGDILIRNVEQDYNEINYFDQVEEAGGIFLPLFDSRKYKIKDQLIVDYDLEVCYDNYWKYNISDGAILLNAILDISERNIIDRNGGPIIHEPSELSIIPDNEVCLALESFENQRKYGKDGKYWLLEKTWTHETIHRNDFIKLINSTLNLTISYFDGYYKYKDLLSNLYKPECNDLFSDKIKAEKEIKKYLNKILNSFIQELKIRYEKILNNPTHESLTHNNPQVQSLITKYKRMLQNSRPLDLWINCPYKEL